MPTADPRNRWRPLTEDKAMLRCNLRVRWKAASDLRFRAAISGPEALSLRAPSCGLVLCQKFLRERILRPKEVLA